eukprot:scaffold551_cov395-Prasinococcus_capsulatus_cf.AAC.21
MDADGRRHEPGGSGNMHQLPTCWCRTPLHRCTAQGCGALAGAGIEGLVPQTWSGHLSERAGEVEFRRLTRRTRHIRLRRSPARLRCNPLAPSMAHKSGSDSRFCRGEAFLPPQ